MRFNTSLKTLLFFAIGFFILSTTSQAAVVAATKDQAGAQTVANAIAAPGTTIGSASFTIVSPSGNPAGVGDSPAGALPSPGLSNFGVLSSGNSTFFGTTANGDVSNGGALTRGARDVVTLAVPITVPAGDSCLSFDYASYTNDPGFKEALIAEVDTNDWTLTGNNANAPHNFATMDTTANHAPVNSTLNPTVFNASFIQDSKYTSGTQLLVARTPITPGNHTVYFSTYDTGDSSVDSTSAIDNLRTSTEDCALGTKQAFTLPSNQTSTTAPVGTNHTTTAILKDDLNKPLANKTVTVKTTGVNPQAVQNLTTDSNGMVSFTQKGTNPGTDTTTFCYDTNGNTTCEANSSSAFQYTPLIVTASKESVTEGNSGTKTVSVNFSLNQASSNQTFVDYTTQNGTTSLDDYVANSGTVVFEPGETEKTVDFLINGDVTTEQNEKFNIVLSNVNGAATNANSNGSVTIQNDDVASISASNPVVDEDSTNAVITLTSDHISDHDLQVAYSTQDNTATNPKDYTSSTGTATIAAGQTSTAIQIPVKDNDVVDGDRDFRVNLSAVANQQSSIANNSLITIKDNEVAKLSVNDPSVNEGNNGSTASSTFVISMSNPSTKDITVDYATQDGSASTPDDYKAKTGTVTIEAGETSVPVSIEVEGDNVAEGDEDFALNLSNPSTGVSIDDNQGVATIVDDEQSVVSTADINVVEGDTGTKQAQITVSTDVINQKDIKVDYATQDGSAKNPADYEAKTGAIIIPAGQTNASADINVAGDEITEGDEDFVVKLSNPTNASLASKDNSVVTINDNDTSALTAQNTEIVEGDNANPVVNVTISVDKANTKDIEVDYKTTDDSATSPADYTETNGTSTIVAGQTSVTVPVAINSDNIAEGDEKFSVDLSNPTNASIQKASGIFTITDDDVARLSTKDVETVEGDADDKTAEITVKSSLASQAESRVDYTTQNNTATSADDYKETNGTLVFQPGETQKTIVVPIKGDKKVEADENFKVVLSNPQNAGIDVDTANVDIKNDDQTKISAKDISVKEGDSGQTIAQVEIVSSLDSDLKSSVDYTTQDNIATNPEDYQKQTGTITFQPGEKTKKVSIVINGDKKVEADELFKVLLNNAKNSSLNTNSANVVIQNDDQKVAPPVDPPVAKDPALSITDKTVSEGNKKSKLVKVKVDLSEKTAKQVSVKYATKNGKAKAKTDYKETNGTLVFQPGETQKTIVVKTYADVDFEKDESFKVVLSEPVGATLKNSEAVVKIENNDKKVCMSNRKFVIHLRPTNKVLTSAKVSVNGEKIKAKRNKNGRYSATIDLRGLKAGKKVTVKIVTKDQNGKTYKETRTYKPCAS